MPWRVCRVPGRPSTIPRFTAGIAMRRGERLRISFFEIQMHPAAPRIHCMPGADEPNFSLDKAFMERGWGLRGDHERLHEDRGALIRPTTCLRRLPYYRATLAPST